MQSLRPKLSLDKLRLQSIKHQRKLQIQRQGIVVYIYHKFNIQNAFIQCDPQNKKKFHSMLSVGVKLLLCELDGQPIIQIKRKDFYLKKDQKDDQLRIYLINKNLVRHLKDGGDYILVKTNATIDILSEVYLNQVQGNCKFYSKLNDFVIEGVKNIPLQKKLQLDFNKQYQLNQKQNQAIQKVFKNHMTFIKGPPGCGKTRTISRMVRMLVQRDQKVLVGSVSNLANQTLITELAQQVRLYNEYYNGYRRQLNMTINYSKVAMQSIPAQFQKFSLNSQISMHMLKLMQYQQQKLPQSTYQLIMEQIVSLQMGEKVSNKFYRLYMTSLNLTMSKVDILISTTIKAYNMNKYLDQQSWFQPDVGIMDQAAQASWGDTYIFLSTGIKRLVLVGDQKQLLPTVIGDVSANSILTETMFTDLKNQNQDYFIELVEQYRMHPQIAEFPSIHFYQGKLKNGIKQGIQNDINSNGDNSNRIGISGNISYFKQFPCSFIQHNQPQILHSTSTFSKPIKQYSNQYQLFLIKQLLLTIASQQYKNIGLLTFYDKQYQLFTQTLLIQIQYGLTVKTIDGYQGGQKDYVIVSMVRCNHEANVGFCNKDNRVNVALTRAKKGLIVIGNPHTLMEGKQLHHQQLNVWGHYLKHMYNKNKLFDVHHYLMYLSKLKSNPQLTQKVISFFTFSKNIITQLKSIKMRINQEEEQQFFQKNGEQKKQTKKFINKIVKPNLDKEISILTKEFICNQQKKQAITIELDRQQQIIKLIRNKFTQIPSIKLYQILQKILPLQTLLLPKPTQFELQTLMNKLKQQLTLRKQQLIQKIVEQLNDQQKRIQIKNIPLKEFKTVYKLLVTKFLIMVLDRIICLLAN